MKWTDSAPIVAGTYWCRQKDKKRSFIVYVVMEEQPYGSGVKVACATDGAAGSWPKPIHERWRNYEWAGPIEEPTDS